MNIPQIFTTGLQKGFARETEFKTVERAGFSLQSSHLEEREAHYHDEWAVKRVGGGQELVQDGQETYTRVYAGGTIKEVALSELDVSKADIMQYLTKCLNNFGNRTRGMQNFARQNEAEWGYEYQVLETNLEIPMSTGKECIYYKEHLVFVHVFVMCPVE